jgi:lipopolysaccharide transport system ATP-binding protein
MSDTVIRVENLSKKYLLGQNGSSDGLRHSIHEAAMAPLRWLKSRPGGSRPEAGAGGAPGRQPKAVKDFWALKDVSFEVKAGEVMGVIGRNGAGKSTLLKILSRITEPTQGRIEISGRIASLLEVGTGFHPELTGRENVFLNGAILGMGRAEIKKRFDEIVAFAEVEKFLDTPVKRYSSGMYVRLAFAVAAHLEPEILIVDEVLAVGDASFQKKCLGKMQDVAAKEGRTVVFVSHNLGVVSSLCQHVVYIDKGSIRVDGTPHEALSAYATTSLILAGRIDLTADNVVRRGDLRARFTSVTLRDATGQETIPAVVEGEDFLLEFSLEVSEAIPLDILDFTIVDPFNNDLFTGKLFDDIQPRSLVPGSYRFQARFSPNFLARGSYNVRLACFGLHYYEYDHILHAFTLLVAPGAEEKPGFSVRPGTVRSKIIWKMFTEDAK